MGTIAKLKEIKAKNSATRVCPICGSVAKMESSEYDPWGDGAGTVKDYWCECEGCGIIKGGRFSTYDDSVADAQRQAEKDWNEVIDYLNTIIVKKDN